MPKHHPYQYMTMLFDLPLSSIYRLHCFTVWSSLKVYSMWIETEWHKALSCSCSSCVTFSTFFRPPHQRSNALDECCGPVTHMLSTSMSRLRLTSPFCSSRSFRPRICSASSGFRSNSAGNSDIQYLIERKREIAKQRELWHSEVMHKIGLGTTSREWVFPVNSLASNVLFKFRIHLCDPTQLSYDTNHTHLQEQEICTGVQKCESTFKKWIWKCIAQNCKGVRIIL